MASSAAGTDPPLVEDLPGHVHGPHGQRPMRISAEVPGRLTGLESGPDRSLVPGWKPGTATAPPRRARKVLPTVVSTVLVLAIFVFALPRFASYRSVWASIEAMTWQQALPVAAAAAASLASYWFM